MIQSWLTQVTLGALSAMLIVSACGTSGGATGGPSTPATPMRVVATTSTMRTLAHALGESVVALGEDALLVDLLDLGVKPVASNANIPMPNQIALAQPNELVGVTLYPSAAELSLEALAALQPDLIVGTRFFVEGAGYGCLTAIAPTVALDGVDALESYLEVARIFGRELEARQRVNAFITRRQRKAARIGAQGRVVSVATVYPGPSVAAWVGGPSPIPRTLLDMGFGLSPDAASAASFGVKNGRAFISSERLDMFAADTLFLLQSASIEGELAALDDIKTGPLWATLPAVRANRVVMLDRIGYPGFRAAQRLLDDILQGVAP